MPETISNLTEAEFATLAEMGLKAFIRDEPRAIDSALLLEDDHCLTVLKKIMPNLGAENLKVTASLVIKRIAFLTLAPVLYSLSVFNKGLNARLENCVFEYSLEARKWRSKQPLKTLSVLLCEEDRSHWRAQILTQAFAENLTRLVEQFYRLFKTPRNILWENIAVRVFSIYERRILATLPSELKQKALDDFQYLIDPTNTAIYGLNKNPIAPFYREKQRTALTDQPIRIRRTCCFYYLATEPAVYCSTCPLPLRKKLA